MSASGVAKSGKSGHCWAEFREGHLGWWEESFPEEEEPEYLKKGQAGKWSPAKELPRRSCRSREHPVLSLCLVSVPDRCAARVTGWAQEAPTCWALVLGPSGCGWAATSHRRRASLGPCSLLHPGSQELIKEEGRSNYVQTSKVKDHEEWGQEGVVLGPVRAACQEGGRDERGWRWLRGH